jgi:hypothetical protein
VGEDFKIDGLLENLQLNTLCIEKQILKCLPGFSLANSDSLYLYLQKS